MENANRRINGLFGHLIPNETAASKCPFSGGNNPSSNSSNCSSCNNSNGQCCSKSTMSSSSSCGCPVLKGMNVSGGKCPYTTYGGVCPKKSSPRLTNDSNPLRVVVTGAAGNIAYSLLFMIANGNMFGKKEVILHLLDIQPMAQALKGVEMELLDCAFPLLKGIVATTDVKTAFMHVDVAILVGAFPRQKGMERKDLLKKNAAIFKEHGSALNDYANRDVKVCVVGNPANTNCLLALQSAPNLSKNNFSCLTRLDHNRAIAQLSQKLNLKNVTDVKNVIIWGNHSATQYPDVSFANVKSFGNPNTITSPVTSSINDDNYIKTEFISSVQQRGAKIIETRKLSSAASAAHAVCCHMRDWMLGTKEGEVVSMGVISDGSYNVPKDIIYSFPVTCSGGNYTIVQGLPLSEFSKKQMKVTADELLEEKTDAFSFLQSS